MSISLQSVTLDIPSNQIHFNNEFEKRTDSVHRLVDNQSVQLENVVASIRTPFKDAKTIMARLLAGRLKPTAGSVNVEGCTGVTSNLTDLVKADFTLIENISYIGLLIGREKFNCDRVFEIINHIELFDKNRNVILSDLPDSLRSVIRKLVVFGVEGCAIFIDYFSIPEIEEKSVLEEYYVRLIQELNTVVFVVDNLAQGDKRVVGQSAEKNYHLLNGIFVESR